MPRLAYAASHPGRLLFKGRYLKLRFSAVGYFRNCTRFFFTRIVAAKEDADMFN